MIKKRGEAQRAAAKARAAAAAAERSEEQDVVPWLRRLGFRADEARHAAVLCESIPNAPLEERLRLALSSLAPSHPRATSNLGARGVTRMATQRG